MEGRGLRLFVVNPAYLAAVRREGMEGRAAM
jgi:hypothetical protein